MEEKSDVIKCECGNTAFTVSNQAHDEDMMSSSTIACNACQKALFRIFTPWVSGEIWIEYPKIEQEENAGKK